MKSYIGLYGLGVMGQSLALNIARHNYSVSVFNKFDYETVTVDFLNRAENLPVQGFKELQDFIDSLEKPRKVLLMVTAGKVVDMIIEELLPLLEQGDMIIDCGNSYFKDTIRRENSLKEKGIHFFGVGVSGGEKGALTGPSIMPGGDESDYRQYLSHLLNDISAHTVEGDACCDYIGPDGAGHYVKMVHNGIEYGDIQIICEAYDVMKNVLRLSNEEMADVFAEWNDGRLNSYLIEITSQILTKVDEETGKYVIDIILDEAGQKGTGKWTSMEALDIGVAVPTIAESVFVRCLSARKEERVHASKVFPKDNIETEFDVKQVLSDLEEAVYASKIVSYAQGFTQLKEASEEYNWNLQFGEIAMLWREGCIIRAQFLSRIKNAFQQNKDLKNLMLADEFANDLKIAQEGWRNIAKLGIEYGIYLPAITNSLMYFDGYRSAVLPANLLQAQRDWFGAHTYHRVDKPHDESFHTYWEDAE